MTASSPSPEPILAPLLLGLTVVTGLGDAVSYLALGHVFTANMTGNVVFLGFAAAGGEGVSAPRSGTGGGAFLPLAGTGGGRGGGARRAASVVTMVGGAAIGGWLLRYSVALPLALCSAVSGVCAVAAYYGMRPGGLEPPAS